MGRCTRTGLSRQMLRRSDLQQDANLCWPLDARWSCTRVLKYVGHPKDRDKDHQQLHVTSPKPAPAPSFGYVASSALFISSYEFEVKSSCHARLYSISAAFASASATKGSIAVAKAQSSPTCFALRPESSFLVL